jgi:NAD(P)-dependent dehydrogenase (short-subunit alcohol dehydrogenase family)
MSDKPKPKVALITGGTKGIGLATALRFAHEGYQSVITYGWGSVDDDQVLEIFAKENLLIPLLKRADVVNEEDTKELIEETHTKYGYIDAFISNVSFSSLIKEINDYSEKSLLKSIEYSTWPLIEYTRQIKNITGQYPNYVIGLSSHGPDGFHLNYDYAAITKSVMEVLIRYLNYHFFNEQVIFNVVRTRPIITDSLLSTLGKEWATFISHYDIPGTDVSEEEVARVIFMLCSGWMDGIRGQTITADKGYDFADGLQYLYAEKERLNL